MQAEGVAGAGRVALRDDVDEPRLGWEEDQKRVVRLFGWQS